MRKVINKKTEFIKDQCKKFVIMIFVTITLQQCFDGTTKALQSSIQPDKNAFLLTARRPTLNCYGHRFQARAGTKL